MKREPKVGDVLTFEGVEGRFVVEDTWYGGGGTGHGPHDVYPDGLHVYCRKLTPSGNFDPDGDKLEFTTSGCFNNRIGLSQITLCKRRMVRTFVWEN